MTAAPVLRLLTPAMLVAAMISPFGWFLQATGRVGRSLNIAFLIAPVSILGIVAGLGYGPTGVALGHSIAMLLLWAPVVAWSKHGTGMTNRDYWSSVKHPLTSGIVAGVVGLGFKAAFVSALSTLPLLSAGVALLLGTYACFLLIVMGQKSLYADLMGSFVRARDR